MSLSIEIENPLTEDALVLITGSEAALREHYPPEECYSFEPEELTQENVTFWMAREGDTPMGIVALVNYGDYGEIKRLYVPGHGRGRGVAKALMNTLEDAARAENLPCIRLETGPKLAPAVALYQALGYTKRGPFGDYADHPSSLFMEKML